MGAGTEDAIGLELAGCGGTAGSGTSPGPNCVYIYTFVSACTRTYAHTVDREQYSQTNANASERKLIIAFNAWAISLQTRLRFAR